MSAPTKTTGAPTDATTPVRERKPAVRYHWHRLSDQSPRWGLLAALHEEATLVQIPTHNQYRFGEKRPDPVPVIPRFTMWMTYADVETYFREMPPAGPRSPTTRHVPMRGVATARLQQEADGAYVLHYKVRSKGKRLPLLRWAPDGDITLYPVRDLGASQLLQDIASGRYGVWSALWELHRGRGGGILSLRHEAPTAPPDKSTVHGWWTATPQLTTYRLRRNGPPVTFRAVEHVEAPVPWVEWVLTNAAEVTEPFEQLHVNRTVCGAAYRQHGVGQFLTWMQARIALDGAPQQQHILLSSTERLARCADPTQYPAILNSLTWQHKQRYRRGVEGHWSLYAIRKELQEEVQATLGRAALRITPVPTLSRAAWQRHHEAETRHSWLLRDV